MKFDFYTLAQVVRWMPDRVRHNDSYCKSWVQIGASFHSLGRGGSKSLNWFKVKADVKFKPEEYKLVFRGFELYVQRRDWAN